MTIPVITMIPYTMIRALTIGAISCQDYPPRAYRQSTNHEIRELPQSLAKRASLTLIQS